MIPYCGEALRKVHTGEAGAVVKRIGPYGGEAGREVYTRQLENRFIAEFLVLHISKTAHPRQIQCGQTAPIAVLHVQIYQILPVPARDLRRVAGELDGGKVRLFPARLVQGRFDGIFHIVVGDTCAAAAVAAKGDSEGGGCFRVSQAAVCRFAQAVVQVCSVRCTDGADGVDYRRSFSRGGYALCLADARLRRVIRRLGDGFSYIRQHGRLPAGLRRKGLYLPLHGSRRALCHRAHRRHCAQKQRRGQQHRKDPFFGLHSGGFLFHYSSHIRSSCSFSSRALASTSTTAGSELSVSFICCLSAPPYLGLRLQF